MRLPWRRPNRTKATEDARRSREQAERDLEAAREQTQHIRRQTDRVRAETPTYRFLGQQLKEIRERNHLREAFEASFRGGSDV